jgi:PKD repeat protein
MKRVLTTALCFTFGSLMAQTASTYAGSQYQGNGRYNSTSNNPIATENYSRPFGLALDANGKIYITDEHNVQLIDGTTNRIRAGYLGDPTAAGAIGSDDGTGTVSRFFTPSGVAIHPTSNDAYVCDRYNSTIRKVSKFVNTSNGQIVSTYTGKASFSGGFKDGLLSVAEFNEPVDMVIDANGIMYVADFGNDCIRKITSTTVSTLCGNPKNPGFADGTGTAAKFDAISGLCLENATSLLVADRNNKRIRRVNLTTGAVTTVISGLDAPNDIVVAKGNIYIMENFSIKVYNGSTTSVFCGSASTGGYTNGTGATARFEQLQQGMYLASDDALLVVDEGNNVIRKITLNPAPIADFIAVPTSATVGQTVILRNKSLYGQTFSWVITPANYALQNGSKLTDTLVYLTFSTAGAYSVSLTATNSYGSNTATKNSYINISNISGSAPVANFSATKTTLAVNEVVQLSDLSSNNPTAWDWSITPATFAYETGSTASSRFPNLRFTAAGIYSVTLKASNSFGNNSATKTNYITVSSLSAVGQVPALMIGVYPVPASSYLRVNLSAHKGSVNAALISTDGRVRHMWTALQGDQFRLNLPDQLEAGVYFLRISDEQFSNSIRISIER